jgi:hypothetical protein
MLTNYYRVCHESNGGVSDDSIVGMKHDRHMEQVELVIVLGREGGQAVAQAAYPR